MRVRLDDDDGHLAADWRLCLRTEPDGRVLVEWIERSTRDGIECMSPSRAMDLFRVLSTRSREKITIFPGKK